MKEWIFRTDEYICDLRTVGVLVRDGKLLVQRDRDGSEYALPGGHVKIGETMQRTGHITFLVTWPVILFPVPIHQIPVWRRTHQA